MKSLTVLMLSAWTMEPTLRGDPPQYEMMAVPAADAIEDHFGVDILGDTEMTSEVAWGGTQVVAISYGADQNGSALGFSLLFKDMPFERLDILDFVIEGDAILFAGELDGGDIQGVITGAVDAVVIQFEDESEKPFQFGFYSSGTTYPPLVGLSPVARKCKCFGAPTNACTQDQCDQAEDCNNNDNDQVYCKNTATWEDILDPDTLPAQ